MSINLKDPSSSPSPPAPASPPAICSDPGTRAANLGESMGMSLLGITGLGGLFNFESPLDKLKKEIQDLKSRTQQAINKGITQFASISYIVQKETLEDINAVNSSLQAYVNMQDEIINGKIILNDIYIFGTYFLLLVVIIFLLISNAFKK
jgi:hypothetical protein